MGQAKKRGSYEERRNAAIIRDGIEREGRRRREAARRAAMTGEERQRYRDKQHAIAQLLAVGLVLGEIPYFVKR